jgi:gluconate kinase
MISDYSVFLILLPSEQHAAINRMMNDAARLIRRTSTTPNADVSRVYREMARRTYPEMKFVYLKEVIGEYTHV